MAKLWETITAAGSVTPNGRLILKPTEPAPVDRLKLRPVNGDDLAKLQGEKERDYIRAHCFGIDEKTGNMLF